MGSFPQHSDMVLGRFGRFSDVVWVSPRVTKSIGKMGNIRAPLAKDIGPNPARTILKSANGKKKVQSAQKITRNFPNFPIFPNFPNFPNFSNFPNFPNISQLSQLYSYGRKPTSFRNANRPLITSTTTTHRSRIAPSSITKSTGLGGNV